MARVRIAVVTTIRYSPRSDLQIITPKDRAQGLSRRRFRLGGIRTSSLSADVRLRVCPVDFFHVLDIIRDSVLLAGEL